MALGKLHLLVLHLPIALVLAAALADVLYALARRRFFRAAGFYCLVFAAASAVPTMVTGLLLADEFDMAGETLELHEHLGIATTVVLLAAAVLRIIRRDRLPSWWAYAYGVLVFAAVVLISAAGHYGGILAFGADYLKGIF